MGQLDPTRGGRLRLRERACLGSEQLTVQPCLIEGGTTDLDEGMGPSRRLPMENGRGTLIVGPIRPADEDGHVGGGESGDGREQVLPWVLHVHSVAEQPPLLMTSPSPTRRPWPMLSCMGPSR